jgi:uncharacterized protein (TIGR03663 family)
MTRALVVLLLLSAALAALLRFPRLDDRPMHNDEAVNAVKFGKLWETGVYRYDLNEHHGPSLYYATLAFNRLSFAPEFSQFSETRLRLVIAIFGLGLVLLLPLITDALGRASLSWAALFTALSPALVFYSRYYIHEILLVFFALLALGAGWRYWRSRRIGWLLLVGAALGLMDATKETFVISLAAAAVAVGLNQTWNRLIDASEQPVKAAPINLWHAAAALGVWVLVAVSVFSSFFANPSGPLDSLRSYLPWINRAGGESPHIYSWHFYLERLAYFHPARSPLWTEGLLLILALAGAIAGFRRRRLVGANASFVRFLAIYAFVLTGFYSFLPYKTPWCLLNFWHPIVLLAGVGAASLIRTLRQTSARLCLTAILLIGAFHLAWQSWQLNTEYAADPRNPYVYAQTSPDLLDLVKSAEAVARLSPEGYLTLVQVVAPEDDYWPLPWYLRRFRNVGWWDKMPPNPYSPILVLSPRIPFSYDESKLHLMGFYGLRPQVPLTLFVDSDLWRRWAAQQRQ